MQLRWKPHKILSHRTIRPLPFIIAIRLPLHAISKISFAYFSLFFISSTSLHNLYISISFDHTENYTKTDGSQITFVYFNFVNNSNLEACPATYFNTSAFQNEESIGLYSYPVGDDSKDVYINNLLETVQPGESIQFAEEIETDELVSPVKIRVDDANIYNQDMSKQQLQQQEISLQ